MKEGISIKDEEKLNRKKKKAPSGSTREVFGNLQTGVIWEIGWR